MSAGVSYREQANLDPRLSHCQREIRTRYDHLVTFQDPARGVNKFGRNRDVNAIREMVWETGGIEVLPEGNTIDSIVASDAADSQLIFISGHTVTGTGINQKFTRVDQVAALNGQTPVSLSIPLARVERAYNTNGTEFAGTLYIYESVGATVTNGVPTPSSIIHASLNELDQQTYKAAITVPDGEYFVISDIEGAVRRGTGVVTDIQIQTADAGRVFRTRYEISASDTSGTIIQTFDPPIIVKPNSDIRLLCSSSGNNTEVNGGFSGYFGTIL